LLGLAVGDALGARFEGQSSEFIRDRAATVEQLVTSAADELWYTDDTQMAIGVAETLAEYGEILEDRLCEAFVANYVPSRGYGRGARVVLEAMADGRDYRDIAANHFPGGSFGNGAAMRVAPVGLFFRHDQQAVLEQARRSATPTHVHPLGIEGAQLVALAVAHAARAEKFDRGAYFAELMQHCRSPEYVDRLAAAEKMASHEDLRSLGNGIEAHESAPTAVASFALTPDSYQQTIGNVILLGGDTDTLAAMAGAISGAYLGTTAIPRELIDRLEQSPKGRTYLLELADRLFAAYQRGMAEGNEF
jgi:poly(ADP-ribose) glycohydrolase ARH3